MEKNSHQFETFVGVWEFQCNLMVQIEYLHTEMTKVNK